MGRILGFAVWTLGAATILTSTHLGWISGLFLGLAVIIASYALLNMDTRADVTQT